MRAHERRTNYTSESDIVNQVVDSQTEIFVL